MCVSVSCELVHEGWKVLVLRLISQFLGKGVKFISLFEIHENGWANFVFYINNTLSMSSFLHQYDPIHSLTNPITQSTYFNHIQDDKIQDLIIRSTNYPKWQSNISVGVCELNKRGFRIVSFRVSEWRTTQNWGVDTVILNVGKWQIMSLGQFGHVSFTRNDIS